MLGLTAPYATGEIKRADDELEDAAWSQRDQVAAAANDDGWEESVEGDGLLLPPWSSIADSSSRSG